MLTYDLDDAVAHLRRVDLPIRQLIDSVGPCTLEAVELGHPYTALVRNIIYQQISGKAAATIYRRLREALDSEEDAALRPEAVLATHPEVLRQAGVSRNKLAAITDLSEKHVAGLIPGSEELVTMDNAAIIERLTQVRGIGRWTAEMLLLFRLGRPDVWPTTDLGVRKGYQITYDLDALPKPKALMGLGERYRPYRSVASWYFWRATDG